MQLGGSSVKKELLTIGGIELDDRTKEVMLDGEKVSLTPTEYDILKLLMENTGKVFTPDEIYSKVWKDNPFGSASDHLHIWILWLGCQNMPGYVENAYG